MSAVPSISSEAQFPRCISLRSGSAHETVALPSAQRGSPMVTPAVSPLYPMKTTRALACSACDNIPPKSVPVASSKAVSITITLAEPSLFLRGFHLHEERQHSTAMLRGTLLVKVNKATEIRSICLRFSGKVRTVWPEGNCNYPWSADNK